MSLSTFFLAEQSAFLRRRTREWRHHLRKVRTFIGDSLQRAPRERPILILGAGSGLEVPWNLAPADCTGWDLDPTSRLRTFLRWGRWPAWVREDLTGGLAELQALTRRSVHPTWSGRPRDTALAARRLAGLIPSLNPEPRALRQWLEERRPSLVVGANWMGQVGVVAQRLVEREFGKALPWMEDPEDEDPLEEALEAWTRRVIQTHLELLRDCGAELCLVYDRAVIHGSAPVNLGPFHPEWTRHLDSPTLLSLSDPLAGLAPQSFVQEAIHWERWIWSLSPEQRHLVEALCQTSRFHQDSVDGMK